MSFLMFAFFPLCFLLTFVLLQLKVFDSSAAGTRKVIVATNIAEASVTIPGIVYGMSMLHHFVTYHGDFSFISLL